MNLPLRIATQNSLRNNFTSNSHANMSNIQCIIILIIFIIIILSLLYLGIKNHSELNKHLGVDNYKNKDKID